MKHELRIMVLAIIAFIVLAMPHNSLFIIPALAQDDNIEESRITPASPLYFLKSVREILELKFAGTTHVRAYRQLEFATRRLREVNSLAQTSEEGLIEPTLVRYLSHLQEFAGIANLYDQTRAGEVTETATEHMNALQGVYSRLSDPRARMSTRVAVNKLSEQQQQFIDKLNSLNKYPLAEKLLVSKLSACNFLSKEASFSAPIESGSALNEVERAVWFERAKKCFE